jgi:HEAT repeat protein
MGAVAIKPLTAMLYHWDENVRNGATWALTKLGTPAAPSLLEALQSDEPLARLSAARALGQIRDQQAITPLNAALQDEYSDIRLAAIGALLRLGAPGTMMVSALKNEEPGVRKAAAWALGHHRFANAVKPLILALQDEEPEVRVSVAKALGAIGDERALQPLLSLSHDPEPEVRAVANEATNTISQAQAQVS